jgi:hypothetical protein
MVEWHYKGDADITIGEVKISKTAKIILIILIIAICAITGLAIYFRHYIYDFIANPQIILATNNVDLEVYGEFSPEDYIINKGDGYEYTVEQLDSIDNSKLGTYKILYKSHNSVKETEIEMTVNVVDTTEPEITLQKDFIFLTRGEETEKFEPKDYLVSVKDNYSPEDKIKVEWTENLNFDNDELAVIYSATDEAGNVATKPLNIGVYESEEQRKKAEEEEELRKQQEEEELRKKQEEEQQKQQQQQPATEKTTTKVTEKQTTKPTEKPTEKATEKPTEKPTEKKTEKVTEKPTEKPKEPEPTEEVTEAPKPKIYGIKNHTFKVGTDYTTILLTITNGVSAGSDWVTPDMSAVNSDVPGTYTVKWSSGNGATATSKVVITE